MKNKLPQITAVAAVTIASTISSQAVATGGAGDKNEPYGPQGALSGAVPAATYLNSGEASSFLESPAGANTSTVRSDRNIVIGSITLHGPTPAGTAFDSIFTVLESTVANNAVYTSPASTAFVSVPDGGNAALLLSSSLLGLTLIKRKFTLRPS